MEVRGDHVPVDTADRDAPKLTDTWILEFEVDSANRRALKSLCALSNGYFGTRALLTAPDAHDDNTTLAGGIYDGESVPGLLHGPSWTTFSSLAGDATMIRGRLDLRRGVLETRLGSGDGDTVHAVQFVSIHDPAIHGIRLIGPESSLVGNRALVEPPKRLGITVDHDAQTDGTTVVVVSSSGSAMAASAVLSRSAVGSGRTDLTKLAAFVASPDGDEGLGATSRELLGRAHRTGFDALLATHSDAWRQRWSAAGIDMPDQPALEQAIRFAQFHLLASSHAGHEAAIGARGLTGDAYRGHVFWDTDVFVVPALSAMAPPLARAALRYRHKRLSVARARAAFEGREGARFPWESAATGEETTPTEGRDLHGEVVAIRTGMIEEHIVADVAWGVATHLAWTGDEQLRRGLGADILVSCARYWQSRVEVDASTDGHIRGVIGPDEYHEAVDDNAFTNVMARWNLTAAADLCDDLLLVDDDERRRWRATADRLVDGFDGELGVHEQFAGYFDLDPVMVSSIGEPPLPADVLIGHARIQETQIIKQPDVLMLHHLVPTLMRPGTLASDLDFYLPRTAHGSSLSPAITAANLARAGRPDDAIAWFELAARLDLDNLGGTTGGGVHLATMGGLWQALTQGFLGIRPGPDRLLVDPHLPAKWGPITQRFRYRDAPIRVEASPDDLEISSPHAVRIQLASGESAMHHRHHVTRSPSGWEFR
jgi:trehalose/maltose hydrolase-like predicted phosphorylase